MRTKRLRHLIDKQSIMADVQGLLARLNSQIVSSGSASGSHQSGYQRPSVSFPIFSPVSTGRRVPKPNVPEKPESASPGADDDLAAKLARHPSSSTSAPSWQMCRNCLPV